LSLLVYTDIDIADSLIAGRLLWNDGMVECWNIGFGGTGSLHDFIEKRPYFDFKTHYSIIPIFQYSRFIMLHIVG